ncbi:MAG TPA: DUF6082 family protein [Candidatus Limnocylindrales bacterium]|nr:DUF6082 family protein [Candidatus Limnocylindrales bacterium]
MTLVDIVVWRPGGQAEEIRPMNDLSVAIAVISTLISSIALVGVMASLLLQARQFRLGRHQAMLWLQSELIRIALDHPDIWELAKSTPTAQQSHIYMNWRIKLMEFGYITGETSEATVRNAASATFASTAWRGWWVVARDFYRLEANIREKRRFFVIMDAEYQTTTRRFEKASG